MNSRVRPPPTPPPATHWLFLTHPLKCFLSCSEGLFYYFHMCIPLCPVFYWLIRQPFIITVIIARSRKYVVDNNSGCNINMSRPCQSYGLVIACTSEAELLFIYISSSWSVFIKMSFFCLWFCPVVLFVSCLVLTCCMFSLLLYPNLKCYMFPVSL